MAMMNFSLAKYIPLKVAAWAMAFFNLVFAITAIIGGGTQLFFGTASDENKLNLIMCVIMGIFNVITGVILVIAIFAAKENYVLLYILLELINLVILTIFAGMNMFREDSFGLSGLFIFCIFMWYGLYLMYKFFWEIKNYNTVNSGVIEISCNTQPNPMIGLPEKAIESTAV